MLRYSDFKSEALRIYREHLAISDVVSGYPEELTVIEYLKEAFEDRGYETRLSKFKCLGWRDRGTFFEYDGDSYPAVAMPYTPPCEISAELVYVGHGLRDEDWKIDPEGKIVLMSMYRDDIDAISLQYRNAVLRGALGTVFIDAFPGVLRRLVVLASLDYRWAPSLPPPIPAVAIRLEDGARLLKNLDKRARIVSDVDVKLEAAGYNFEASKDSSWELLVTAHHDHWLSGFADDVLGVIMLILLSSEIGLPNNVKFVSFGAEEAGASGFSPWYWMWGSRNYLESIQEDDLDRLVAVVNIDVVSKMPLTVSASGPEFLESLRALLGEGFEYTLDQAYFDSYSFSRRGIAAMTLQSMAPYIEFYHTDKDLPSSIDWSAAYLGYKALMEILGELARKGREFFDYGAIKLWINGRLKPLAKDYAEAGEILEKIHNIEFGEKEARLIRSEFVSVSYEGRYDKVLRLFETFFIPQLNIAGDLEILNNALSLIREGHREDALKALGKVTSYRVRPGDEQLLPYIELEGALRSLKSKSDRELEEYIRWLIYVARRHIQAVLRDIDRFFDNMQRRTQSPETVFK